MNTKKKWTPSKEKANEQPFMKPKKPLDGETKQNFSGPLPSQPFAKKQIKKSKKY
ncbi:hypothetical protein WJR50_32865 [Catalinimonas sp. 4WD22]|uniref:hypothetical protein n=1 Tax=Catalinimonas locisalis TaxID=3133978 RepID=UPI0031012F49